MNLNVTWRFNSNPRTNVTTVEAGKGLTSEAVIKEEIGASLGDRSLAQYIVIVSIKKTP